jgi:hypothetical protein
MTGCRSGAKNMLTENYLYLAERAGARVIPMTTVTAVRPQAGGGYQVDVVTTGRLPRRPRTLTAGQVVVARRALPAGRGRSPGPPGRAGRRPGCAARAYIADGGRRCGGRCTAGRVRCAALGGGPVWAVYGGRAITTRGRAEEMHRLRSWG